VEACKKEGEKSASPEVEGKNGWRLGRYEKQQKGSTKKLAIATKVGKTLRVACQLQKRESKGLSQAMQGQQVLEKLKGEAYGRPSAAGTHRKKTREDKRKKAAESRDGVEGADGMGEFLHIRLSP